MNHTSITALGRKRWQSFILVALSLLGIVLGFGFASGQNSIAGLPQAGSSQPTGCTSTSVHPLSWNAAIAGVKQHKPGSQAVVAFIGDSWVQNKAIEQPFQTGLQAYYGNAGPGYVDIGGNHGPPFGSGVIYKRTGPWKDILRAPNSMSVDLAEATTVVTSTPAQVHVRSAAASFTVHYLRQPDGGTWSYQIDRGSPREVSTASSVPAYATTCIPLVPGIHSLEIKVAAPGRGVTLMGIDVQTMNGGIYVDRLGTGGSTAAEYAAADGEAWRTGLATLRPNLVVLLLGTNDQATGESPTTYAADMTTVIQRIRMAVPQSGIVIVGPSDNGDRRRFPVQQYVKAMKAVATRLHTSYLDTYALLGPYATARQLYVDPRHLNAVGGRRVAAALQQLIVHYR